ncbi:MAG TPA: glycosyltransferase family 4 protein [Gaiellaceae bacterium]|nr:glycosyltransferase family 4 protein [Gaiellaceae bacterium]
MKVLLATMYWPPAGGGGVPRPLKMATYLPELGIETHVLVPSDSKRMHRDESLVPPPAAIVHETRNLAPRVHRPKVELAQAHGLARVRLQAALTARRLLVPDASSPWLLTAVPEAIRLVRRHGIDVVITSSPPGSVNLLGAAVKRATGVRWVADLRDSLISHPHRRQDVRGERRVARLVARYADAIVCVAPAAVEEMQALSPRGPVELIDHGADFDDFAGLEYTRGDRFRITHTGTIFGRRDPKPFLRALARVDGDVVARFVGDFRDADRAVIAELGLGDRVELIPYQPRRQALALQRDSDALLLLVPAGDGRGRFVVTTKIFEYLAAGRPILAAVPEEGAAAALLRETGAGVVTPPDDEDAIAEALAGLVAGWRDGSLNGVTLTPEVRESLSRRARVERFAEVLRSLP